MPNSNNENFYKELGYTDVFNLFNLDYFDLNQRILFWVKNIYLSPSRKFNLVRSCKKQIVIVWDLFLEWIESNGIFFDIQSNDNNILQQFKVELPFLGWSASAIQLIEALTIKVNRHLHRKKIFYYSYCSKPSYSNHLFYILVNDYRTIRNYIYETGHDYEILFFELSSALPIFIGELNQIKGSDFIFYNNRYYLKKKDLFEDKEKIYFCPQHVSRSIYKLLKSRNILSDEIIFDNIPRIGSSLNRKIRMVCLKNNIPLFATNSIWGFLSYYIRYLVCKGVYKYETVRPLLKSPRRITSYSNSLRLLDKLYRQITEGDEYHEISSNIWNSMQMEGGPEHFDILNAHFYTN